MNTTMQGTGAPHPFVIPLTKIDHEKRLVIGIAAHEIADKAKEIMDYSSAKEQFQSWSKGFQDATGGLSKGNLRVMHTKTVAGRFDDISFDDEKQQVLVCAKVTDDNEWRKVLDGNYTGFSIGGGYKQKWQDPNDPTLTRYTPIVREISLVDNPCQDTARFCELVKADGMVEQLELRGVPRTFGELRKMAADAEAARPRTFAELMQKAADAEAARPKTFGELAKAYDEGKHKRGKGGQFASNVGAVERNAGAIAGATLGINAGLHLADKHLGNVGAKLAGAFGNMANTPTTRIMRTQFGGAKTAKLYAAAGRKVGGSVKMKLAAGLGTAALATMAGHSLDSWLNAPRKRKPKKAAASPKAGA